MYQIMSCVCVWQSFVYALLEYLAMSKHKVLPLTPSGLPLTLSGLPLTLSGPDLNP